MLASKIAFIGPSGVRYKVRTTDNRTYYCVLRTLVKALGADGLCFLNSTLPTFGFLDVG